MFPILLHFRITQGLEKQYQFPGPTLDQLNLGLWWLQDFSIDSMYKLLHGSKVHQD